MASLDCYFSGVESQQHWDNCVSVGVKNVLMSYWQFYKRQPTLVRDRKKSYPAAKFMVDSGAHTFITDWTKFRTWTRKDFDDYVEGYYNWILANRQYVHAVVETDLDYCLNMVLAGSEKSDLGPTIVSSWQNKYFRALEELGINVVYVWHRERKIEGWEDMCARHSYVGLPGEMSSETDFNRFMSIARRFTTRVHGFAATKQKDFRDINWASIDSITWKSGEMWGTCIVWDEAAQKLTFAEKQDRVLYRGIMDARGFNSDEIIRDTNYKEVTRFCLDSMRRMEAFYSAKYELRLDYHTLRLPHVKVIQRMAENRLRRLWQKFRPDELFKHHVEPKESELRDALLALGSVQSGDYSLLKAFPALVSFLKVYFPALADPLPQDTRIFQRELSAYISPRNPPAQLRSSMDHYVAENNPSKKRPVDEYDRVIREALGPGPSQTVPVEFLESLGMI